MRDWRRRNPAKVSCQAALATKLRKRRRPSWLTAEHKARILAFYVEARRLGLETGLEHHVDHIVPLRGKTVSGLHVPWNLQVLPGSLNRSKSNKF